MNFTFDRRLVALAANHAIELADNQNIFYNIKQAIFVTVDSSGSKTRFRVKVNRNAVFIVLG